MLPLLFVVLLQSTQAQLWYDDLLASAGYGRMPYERAAFLIVERDGSLTLAPWSCGGVRHARYRGAIPSRTLAIVHTHPRGEPQPSSGDRAEARRLGIAVIVVSSESVIAAMPDGATRVLSR